MKKKLKKLADIGMKGEEGNKKYRKRSGRKRKIIMRNIITYFVKSFMLIYFIQMIDIQVSSYFIPRLSLIFQPRVYF